MFLLLGGCPPLLVNSNCGTAPKFGAIVAIRELGIFLLTWSTWTKNYFRILILINEKKKIHRLQKYDYKNKSFIINCHIYISSVSVLDNKCLISPEFQRFFRYLLLRKPLIHLRNVCLEFSRWCVFINRHFHHVNEALCSVMSVAQWDNAFYWWSLGWVLESRLEY